MARQWFVPVRICARARVYPPDCHRQEELAVRWLERADRRAAAIQSLFARAKLNGFDALRWLADILEKLPTCPNCQIDSLPPFANSTGK